MLDAAPSCQMVEVDQPSADLERAGRQLVLVLHPYRRAEAAVEQGPAALRRGMKSAIDRCGCRVEHGEKHRRARCWVLRAGCYVFGCWVLCAGCSRCSSTVDGRNAACNRNGTEEHMHLRNIAIASAVAIGLSTSLA